MSDKVDEEKRGEISVMDNPHKAARLVETLLEAGFGKERIRVFTGNEMELQVTHRPVVALVENDAPAEEPDDAINVPAELEADQESALPRAKAELQEVGAGGTPFVGNGVRSSPLFRSP
jgi:hypothetical protein